MKKADLGIFDVRRGDNGDSMLVDVVEFMEDGQRLIPSRVWLRPLDQCNCGIRKSRELTSRDTIEFGIRIRDGESEVFNVGRGGLSSFFRGQRTNEVVEHTPEVVQSVSSHEPPSDQVGVATELDEVSTLRRVLVYFRDNGIGVRVNPSRDFLVERVKVFGAPFVLVAENLEQRVQRPTLGSL